MAGVGVLTQDRVALGRVGDELPGALDRELVGGDVVRDGGPDLLAVGAGRGVLVLEVGPVATDAQHEALAQLDGADRTGVDVTQLLGEALEALGEADQPLPGTPGQRGQGPGGRRRAPGPARPEVEPGQPVRPGDLAGRDPVEVGLHLGGERVVHQAREVLLEQPGHREGEPLRHQGVALVPDVAPVDDRADRGGVGGRPADAALLQRLDQAGLGVAAGRARGVIRGGEVLGVDAATLLELRQPALGLGLAGHLVAVGVTALLVGGQEAARGDDGAGGRQLHGPAVGRGRPDADAGGGAAGIGHL